MDGDDSTIDWQVFLSVCSASGSGQLPCSRADTHPSGVARGGDGTLDMTYLLSCTPVSGNKSSRNLQSLQGDTSRACEVQEAKYTTATNLFALKEIIDCLTVEQREVVRGSGFGGILTLKPFNLDLGMLAWLVDNFNPETGYLDVHGHSFEVTTEDVVSCFGVPNGGKDLTTALMCTDISSALEDELNIAVKDGCILFCELHESLHKLKTAGTQFKAKFFLLLMHDLLCPGESHGFYREVVAFVARAGDLSEYDWCKYVLNKLMFGVRAAQALCLPEVSGCVAMLIVLYVGRIGFGDDMVDLNLSSNIPWVGQWRNDDVNLAVAKLKSIGAFSSDFTWPVEFAVKTQMRPDKVPSPPENDTCFERRLISVENSSMEIKKELIAVRETTTAMARTLEMLMAVLVRDERKSCAGEGDKAGRGLHVDDTHLLSTKVGNGSKGNGNRAANLANLKPSSVVQLSSSGGGFQPQYADVQDSGHRLNPLTIRDSDSAQSNDVTSPVKHGKGIMNNATKRGCRRALWPTSGARGLSKRVHTVSSRDNSQMSSTGSKKVHCVGVKKQKTLKRHGTCKLKSRLHTSAGHGQKTKYRGVTPTCDNAALELNQIFKAASNNGGECDYLPVHTFAQVVDFIFHPRHMQSETLLLMMGQVACREHLMSLSPGVWISSEVINCYAAWLTCRFRRLCPFATAAIWFLPAVAQHLVLANNLSAEMLYTDYLTEASFGGPVYACSKICVPMNYRCEHWFLFVIDLTEHKVLIYDSLPDENQNVGREAITDLVRRRIHEALLFGCGPAYKHDICQFPVERPLWCPIQPNTFDCGLYVMKFMEHVQELRRGITFEFMSSQERLKIAVNLFLSECNCSMRGVVLHGVPGFDHLLHVAAREPAL